MYRKSGLVTLIVFVLSFFFYPFVAAADIPDEAQNESVKVDNTSNKMDIAVQNYDAIKSAMETLNGQWDSNQEKVAKGMDVTVSITGGAIISVAVAVASGGSLAPAAFAAMLAAKTAGETAATSWSSQKYVDAMGTVSGVLSSALPEVQTTYSTYSSRYSDYIDEYAKHNLIRFMPNNTPTSVYTSVQLDYAVNTSDVDDGYYHASASSPSDYDHAIRQKQYYKHWEEKPLGYGNYLWNTVALEAEYECKGTCTVKFESPYNAWGDHREKCGLPETQTVTPLADYNTRVALLAIRTVVQGCGETWYTCDSDVAEQAAWHQIRTCAKTYTNSNGVSSKCLDDEGEVVKFRRCLGHTRDHNESDWIPLESPHSDVADSSSPVASPTPTPTDSTPNCPDCTTHCSSRCSCTNSGTCGGTVSYHACGDHETSVSGDHSLQASCSSTDSNGNSCTVTNFYACDNHSHVYPVPSIVACGGASWTGCSGASSRTEHHVSLCSNCGNGYWTCSQWAYRHTTQNTCRRPGCGVTYYECQNGPCISDWGPHAYHWAQ